MKAADKGRNSLHRRDPHSTLDTLACQPGLVNTGRTVLPTTRRIMTTITIPSDIDLYKGRSWITGTLRNPTFLIDATH